MWCSGPVPPMVQTAVETLTVRENIPLHSTNATRSQRGTNRRGNSSEIFSFPHVSCHLNTTLSRTRTHSATCTHTRTQQSTPLSTAGRGSQSARQTAKAPLISDQTPPTGGDGENCSIACNLTTSDLHAFYRNWETQNRQVVTRQTTRKDAPF